MGSFQRFDSTLSALLLCSCASSGVHYSGVVAEPLVRAEAVHEQAVPDPTAVDAVELGSIHARCSLAVGPLEEGATYGDLACSRELLVSAIQDRVAFVGGTHLTDLVCDVDDGERACSARVLRIPPPGARPLARQAAFDPFDVEVRLLPADEARQAPAAAGRAQMVPRVPVSDVVLGSVSARCSSCDAARLHEAIATGARHAGVRHFGYPECGSYDGQPLHSGEPARCRSWASVYQTELRSRTE